jgi:radical SAM protein with 4Fe4S-binding SPASM domain
VELVLTSRCNLRCAYCFENSRSGSAMSWVVARAALDAALSPRGPVRVVFFGGEPTLEFATIRRAVAHVAARRALRRVRFVLVTNGTRLGAEEIAFLVRHRIETQISFDGTPGAQALRGASTFAKLDRLLDDLREEHPAFFRRSVSVAMTLSPATIPEFPRAIACVLGKGVGDVKVAVDMLGDRAWCASMEPALDRAFAEAAHQVKEHYRRTGRVPVALFRKERRPPRRAAGPIPMCSVTRGGRLAVDTDGSVLICSAFARSVQRFPSTALGAILEGVDLGNVRDPALAARVAAIPDVARVIRLFHDKQDKYSSHGRCADCRYLRSCGLCPASIAQIPGNDDPDRIPDYPCAFNRVWLKYRSRFPVLRPPGRRAATRSRRLPHRLRSVVSD